MIKKTFLFTFVTFIVGVSLYGGEPYYASLKGDTLRMGNAQIERCMRWNSGNPVTIYLVNKINGQKLSTKAKSPDFSLVGDTPKEARFSVKTVPSNDIHPTYLEACITSSYGSLFVERKYKIYADCPAIACDTYLKGHLGDYSHGATQSGADRKNIESAGDMSIGVKTPTLDRLQLDGNHWKVRTVEFFDYTDWNDNLVVEREWFPYRRNTFKGNLLFANDELNGNGFFFLKEAPCSSTQLHYTGADFVADFSDFMVVGLGVSASDIRVDDWARLYGCVTGIYTGGEREALMTLRKYQKQLRLQTAEQDEMIMLNTWGDRSQDSKIDEKFCLAELNKAARMGITVFQLDDGWQNGKSPNSKTAGGSFNDIWKKRDYWIPNPAKFPHGLKPIVEKGKKLGIRIGLWFNPSIQDDFADWQKDADVIISLYHQYGIECFKIDGLQIPTKQAEKNLRRLFDRVLEQTQHKVIFNLDATAGRRGGYHFMNEYGNIFLENRYTDWGNYYPYRTLRNLWQLSRYVPAEKLQVEFLNNWRNHDKYPPTDVFAPQHYSFEYLFAVTLAAQPLAWMEASNLPESAFNQPALFEAYKKIQLPFHQGIILPIGEEPSGRSWTGFQSISDAHSGYIIVYREDNNRSSARLKTWLSEGQKVSFVPVYGSGASFTAEVNSGSEVTFSLPDKNDFTLYQYTITE